MTNLEVLISARNLITDPDRWGRHYCATDSQYNPVNVTNDKACRYCMLGSIMKVLNTDSIDDERLIQIEKLLTDTITKFQINRSIVDFNDNRSHEDILRIYDETILSLRLNIKSDDVGKSL